MLTHDREAASAVAAATFGARAPGAGELAEIASRQAGGGPIHLAFEGGARGAWADRLREARVELVVPVRSQGELVGLVLVGASPDGLPYTRPELAFARAIAARAGVAIHRARLAEEL